MLGHSARARRAQNIGRKNDSLTVERRRGALEERLRSGTWSRRVARSVADEYGITVRQVYRDREAVLDAWSRNLGAQDRQREAARLLEEVRTLRGATASQGLRESDSGMIKWAVQLLTLEADLLRLRDPVQIDVRMTQDEPEALAREVVALLPFVSEILDLDIAVPVIDITPPGE